MTFIHNNSDNENKQKKRKIRFGSFRNLQLKLAKKPKKGLTQELLQQLLENQE